MYYLIVYDVNKKRVAKVHKTLIAYMHWIQNSVFEGELTPATLQELKNKLNKILEKDKDSIIIFEIGEHNYRAKQILGIEKANIDNML